MHLGKIAGIPLKLNIFFLILMAAMTMGGFWLETLLIFFVVYLHELTHTIAARKIGIEAGEIELLPFGGVARIDDALELDPRAEKYVALAGPLSNFILAGIGLAVYANGLYAGESLLFFVRFNLSLAFFNLLPAFPLDGGRLLRANLAPVIGFKKATSLTLDISKGIALLLLLAGAIGMAVGLGHPVLLFAGLFLFYSARKEEQRAVYQFLRYLLRKREEIEKGRVLAAVFITAREDAALKEILAQFMPRKFHFILVLNRSLEVIGEITEKEVIEKALREGIYIKVKELLKR